VAVYGGKPIRQQTEKLQRGVEVVVGTPGRIMDHMSRHNLFLGDLRQVVLDEADRMLDIGFRPDIEKILRHCPESRQTLLFSATLPAPVLRLAQCYMRDPEAMDFSAQDVAVETIEQSYFTIDPGQKFDLLVKLLDREQPAQAIIFCRTRRGTERIEQRLSKRHKDAACIHGDLPQRTRDRVMEGFRAGKIRLLVATDVMGGGSTSPASRTSSTSTCPSSATTTSTAWAAPAAWAARHGLHVRHAGGRPATHADRDADQPTPEA